MIMMITYIEWDHACGLENRLLIQMEYQDVFKESHRLRIRFEKK